MKARETTWFLLVVAAWLSAGGASLRAAPLGTAFTYQGRVKLAGAPLNAAADFQFSLWDDAGSGSPPAGGAQVGATQTVTNVTVTGGLFTVQLNAGGEFGASAFNGDARWLQIAVRSPAGGGSYSTLSPRQPLSAAPYALYALNSSPWEAVGSAITNANSGFVGINRSTTVSTAEYFGIQAPVSNGYGGMYIRTDGALGKPFYGYAAPGNASWTYLDGATDKWHLYHGGTERITVDTNGNVGIGSTNPGARLDVSTSSGHAIDASSSALSSYGVRGIGLSAGVRGECGIINAAGVHGVDTGSGGYGVRGESTSAGGCGVGGHNDNGTGVFGRSSNGYAIYGTNNGSNTTGYAGYFNGRVHVSGTLSKSGGSFKIDHPLDPENKYLSHSFVESPDMKNVYDGVVTTDVNGEAIVQLPAWFEALNRDFRYQLTVIGQFAQAIILKEVADNRFAIKTDKPNVKVSWQITGIRQDAWANAHRIVVEEDKAEAERGKLLAPEAHGRPAELGIHYVKPVSAKDGPSIERKSS